MDGWRLATVASGVVQTISRTNADGTSDTINGGTATPSRPVVGRDAVGGHGGPARHAHVTAVQGAVAYAWYLGISRRHLYMQQITTINSVNFNDGAGHDDPGLRRARRVGQVARSGRSASTASCTRPRSTRRRAATTARWRPAPTAREPR
jgi:hypothetical protein